MLYFLLSRYSLPPSHDAKTQRLHCTVHSDCFDSSTNFPIHGPSIAEPANCPDTRTVSFDPNTLCCVLNRKSVHTKKKLINWFIFYWKTLQDTRTLVIWCFCGKFSISNTLHQCTGSSPASGNATSSLRNCIVLINCFVLARMPLATSGYRCSSWERCINDSGMYPRNAASGLGKLPGTTEPWSGSSSWYM